VPSPVAPPVELAPPVVPVLVAERAPPVEPVLVVPAESALMVAAADPTPTSAPVPVDPLLIPADEASQAATGVPPGWYADPAGRYEYRYWGGEEWTEHVTRDNRQFIDAPIP
jgi:hypothetical protein